MTALSMDAGPAAAVPVAGGFGADDPFLAAFVGYWRAQVRGRGRLPTRVEINPVDMPALLTRMLITDAPVLARICRIHVAGLAIEQIHGVPLTGCGVDTGRFATNEDSLLPRLLRAAPRHRGLVYGEGEWATHGGERLYGRGVGAPLGAGGSAVTDVVICLATLETAETAVSGGMVAPLDTAV
jgi:hypothetical protein